MGVTTTIHYCRADKKKGKPIHVTDMKTKTVEKTNHWEWIGVDDKGMRVRFSVTFMNATGKAKASGATSVLKMEYLD